MEGIVEHWIGIAEHDEVVVDEVAVGAAALT